MIVRPVVAIAGLACENSTFTLTRTHTAAFHVKRGDEITSQYPFLRTDTDLGNAIDWRGILTAYALPGGTVTRGAFEELASELVARLTQAVETHGRPLDGLWFDIHGAMSVEGVDDVEAELLRRVRAVIGPTTIVSASMDLHGNVSRELAHGVDLITCYRTAPHEDVLETKERACRNLVEVLWRGVRPFKAWVPVPVLLPGEQTSTRMEPAKEIYAIVAEVEKTEGVLDAAVWVGYPWADEPRNRAAVVVTGWHEQAVAAGAERLAELFWSRHKDFAFVAPTGSLEACLNRALVSAARPYFISDSGDNPTAGGSGDVTWGLTQILARPEFKSSSDLAVIYASIPGPEATRMCVEAGIGAIVTVTAGAEVDNVHSGPVTMTGRVHSIKHGDKHAIVEVVLQVGSVFVIITKMRKPYHQEHDFTDLNLSPRSVGLTVVKIGYLEPELYNMAADWMLALTPGGVDQDLDRLGHHRIRRPMWPFDAVFATKPNLRARLIPMSNEPLIGMSE